MSRGAVALTFDDLNVDGWCAAMPLFAEFDARATFCVSGLHKATAEQLDGLYRLQGAGHEIACHSRTHPRLGPYLRKHGLARWVEEELDRCIDDHRAAGFPAKSFACPFHAFTPETLAACAKRFTTTRAAGPRSVRAETRENRIYTAPAARVDNLGFCDLRHRAFPGWEWQGALLDMVAERQGIAAFTGHDIREEESGPGLYSTHGDLRRFLGEAVERGVGFVTLGEVGKGHQGGPPDTRIDGGP